jgi:hypothetical protein
MLTYHMQVFLIGIALGSVLTLITQEIILIIKQHLRNRNKIKL